MKYVTAILLFWTCLLSAQDATIKIDIDRVIDDIDPKIYGVFMEPIEFNMREFKGNTLYGPVYDPESPLANKDGFNKEYVEAAKELGLTNMRWPGGNYVSNYNWQDGIGPKQQRPVRKELVWGFNETNQVGTDEWVQLNKAIGSENVVCINMGTGTIDDARYWVEYCNGEKGTYYADLRSKYGHPEPFDIKYWCLGNEVDGSPWIMGYKNAEDYCKLAKEIAKAMKKTDPDISLVANGSSYYQPDMNWVEWNWMVLNELKDLADYLSLHRYWVYSDDYYTYMGQQAMELEEKISIPASQSKTVQTIYKTEKPVYLSFDEWAAHGRGFLSTLANAQFLNAFIRHADMVKMANYTLLTSILSFDPESKKSYKTPFFYTFRMFSKNCHGKSLDVFVDCDTFNADDFYRGIPYLDVSAVFAEDDKSLIINVVNRHKDEAIKTDIQCCTGNFSGKANVQEVYREDLQETYSYEKREEYKPVSREISTDGSKISYPFPPHSFTQIIVGFDK
ncbi:MAG: alpha-N-arabinofuranosidase [Bacteroidales bacterium]|nr:alpha-N-arabinofuranosidase [Bacteroidales bacterium]